MLETKSISEEQQSQYGFYLQKFKHFCLESGLKRPLRTKVDETIDALFGVNYSEKTVAAMEFYN